ncbi:6-phosphogluconolactonase (P9_lactonase) (Polysaccharide utilization locus H protein P9) (PUL H protein P9), partial [Durusdinium trenchii]
TGELTEVGDLHEKDGTGSFLALGSDGRFLYSVAKEGAAAFSVEPSGTLTHLNTVKCDVSGGAHVAVAYAGSAGMVISAAYHGGGVNLLKIKPDGSLGEASSILHKGEGEAHPHSCLIDERGKYGLISDLGLDRIYVYRLDVAAGALIEEEVLSTAAKAGPRHMCFHPKGRFVYGINELDCTINVYAFRKDDAILGPILQTVSTLPEGYNNHDHGNAKNVKGDPASGPNRPDQTNATADIHISPDGRFLYGSNRGHDSLVCFSIARDGLLKLVGFTYTGGEHPRNFSIHPSGNWILVANQDSDNVVVFRRDRRSGELEDSGKRVNMKTARCILWGNPRRKLRKPTWHTVADLTPEQKGVNLYVKVVKVLSVGDSGLGFWRQRIALEDGQDVNEVVLGDATGVVTLRPREEQVQSCVEGSILRIQNANIRMVANHIRLEVSKWGVLKADEHEDFEPCTSNDISAVEYELK